MFQGASRAFTAKGEKPAGQPKPLKASGEGSDIDKLKAELAALHAKIDRLSE